MNRLASWALSLALTASLIVGLPAAVAQANFTISGKVTDATGAPLSNVYVALDQQVRFTDEAGLYRFDLFYPGSYEVDFQRYDLLQEDRTADVSLQSPNATLDLVMRFWMRPGTYLTEITSLPYELDITATTYAPPTLCFYAASSATSAGVPLQYVGQDQFGASIYNARYVVPEGTPPGYRSVALVGRNCDSQQQGALGYFPFRVAMPSPPDTTPPDASIVAPAEGQVTLEYLAITPSHDGSTHVIGSVDFIAAVSDDQRVQRVVFELFRSSGEIAWNCEAYRESGNNYSCSSLLFTGTSRWEFRVTAYDAAGNMAVRSRYFDVNGGPVERDRIVEL